MRLHGSEVVMYTIKTINFLEECEIWFHYKMLQTAWIKKISNSRILEMGNTERSIGETIKKQKIEYFGHVLQGLKEEHTKLTI